MFSCQGSESLHLEIEWLPCMLDGAPQLSHQGLQAWGADGRMILRYNTNAKHMLASKTHGEEMIDSLCIDNGKSVAMWWSRCVDFLRGGSFIEDNGTDGLWPKQQKVWVGPLVSLAKGVTWQIWGVVKTVRDGSCVRQLAQKRCCFQFVLQESYQRSAHIPGPRSRAIRTRKGHVKLPKNERRLQSEEEPAASTRTFHVGSDAGAEVGCWTLWSANLNDGGDGCTNVTSQRFLMLSHLTVSNHRKFMISSS